VQGCETTVGKPCQTTGAPLADYYCFINGGAANPGRSRLSGGQTFSEKFLPASHNSWMRHYERRLPHWDTVDEPLFVTFRLHGSLPAQRVFPPAGLAQSGKAFVAMDRLLDRGASGPLYLRRREIAELVVRAVQDGERHLHRYQLHAFVVMPNHVHLLVTPKVVAARWLAPLKGFTAYQANGVLILAGREL